MGRGAANLITATPVPDPLSYFAPTKPLQPQGQHGQSLREGERREGIGGGQGSDREERQGTEAEAVTSDKGTVLCLISLDNRGGVTFRDERNGSD